MKYTHLLLQPLLLLLLLLQPGLRVQADSNLVQVQHAVARLMPPGVSNTAIYMQLRNDSADPVQLVGARAPWADRVELHGHFHDDGVMRMRPIGSARIAPQGQVEFKPGGQHVMVFGLRQPLRADQTLPLTLLFNNGVEQTTQVVVKKDIQAFLAQRQSSSLEKTGTTPGANSINQKDIHDGHHNH